MLQYQGHGYKSERRFLWVVIVKVKSGKRRKRNPRL
jgi:hypothetical protein